MFDTIVVSIPTRPWALWAIKDLAAEGLSAELLDQLDERGLCQLRISGPFESVDVIRREFHAPRAQVCWESFVNEAVMGSPLT